MIKPVTCAVVVVALVSGCSGFRDSRANPVNWFGGGRTGPAPVAQDPSAANPLIPAERPGLFGRADDLAAIDLSTPITQITELRAERIPGGVIVRASGVDPVQGAYNVFLRRVQDSPSGVLAFSLQRELPSRPQAGGSDFSRTVTAAIRLTDQDLEGIRQIRVEGQQNALTTRR